MFVKEITKRYDGKAVVDGVSFEIPKGKVLSLIGPNGAGKSTVMGMLSRLIARDSGLVDFEGTEIRRWKSRRYEKVVIQKTLEQDFTAQLLKNRRRDGRNVITQK